MAEKKEAMCGWMAEPPETTMSKLPPMAALHFE
jgi:hypothetical protein